MPSKLTPRQRELMLEFARTERQFKGTVEGLTDMEAQSSGSQAGGTCGTGGTHSGGGATSSAAGGSSHAAGSSSSSSSHSSSDAADKDGHPGARRTQPKF